jgi:hypothetical protein
MQPNQSGSNRTPSATKTATGLRQACVTGDPDLAAVVDAWPELPEAIRAGISAMVKAASNC